MSTAAQQRAYRAACPGCGAPVEFKSAQSTHAVCGYCQSTVVRNGDTLQRIGKMAELFDEHSPLQLQASGHWQGQAFTLVGRLQYKYAEGTWTEWYALRDDGSSAYLSEDNGAYVLATPVPTPATLPAASAFRVGASTAISGQRFAVASNSSVMLLSAQGELPRLPQLGQAFAMVELRSQGSAKPGEDSTSTGTQAPGLSEGRHTGASERVLCIDYSSQPPSLSMGQPVQLEDLKLSGLRDESAKDEKARQFNCPNCASALTVNLASSQSMTCSACNSLIDLSQGIGGELKHAIQDEPVNPLIPLGSTGLLQGVNWQVVGFQHRMGVDPSDPDEHFGWEEYLLYNVKRGFTFLVDSTEGWSLVKPVTGAPTLGATVSSVTYQGTRYQLKESYSAETTYAVGEFYWQVSRGQKTSNRDYVSDSKRLSMEQSAHEVTWSCGSTLSSATVAKAFKLEDKQALLARSDAAPISAMSVRNLILIFMLLMVLSAVISRCSSCDPAQQNCQSTTSSRSSGGSFGGFSGGGGGHK